MSTIKSSAENLTLNADGANNDVIIQSNGSTKVTVDGQNSRVGIGTTSPQNPLEISGNTNYLMRLTQTGTNKHMLKTVGNGASLELLCDGANNYVGLNSTTNGDDIRFQTNDGNERMRMLAAGGLTFNGDTAASNALNDYEEGNHAAAFTAASSGSITIGRNDLGYTKIGNMVHCTGEISVSSVSSPNGGTRLSLPFAIASHTVDRNMNWGGQGMICYSVAHYEDNPPCLFASAGTSYVALLYQRDDNSFYDYNAAAGDTFMFSFSYKTSA